MLIRLSVCAAIFAVLSASVKAEGLIEVFKWKQIEYDGLDNYGGGNANRGSGDVDSKIVFPDDESLAALSGGQSRYHNRGPNRPSNQQSMASELPTQGQASPLENYIPYNNVPMGVNHHNNKLFICIPRRRPGIPSTLNFIDTRAVKGNPSPKLRAYPSQALNQLEPNAQRDINRIVSVYRTRVDACNRLWFIDTGLLEYPGNRQQIQQPSIWVVDLDTDKPVHRFEIPSSVVTNGAGLASITIDVDPRACNDAFAYIPDLTNSALYVYRLRDSRIWTFRHNYFHFDPLQGDFDIGGQQFQWDDGIFSITLGNKNRDGYRTAFFHPMASTSEFAVSTRVLKNETNAERSYHGSDFQYLGNRGALRQSTMHDFDPKTGIIFYDEIARNGVGCWNTNSPLSESRMGTVQNDERTMIYPSDLTIDTDGDMWVMTNSMPIFQYSRLNPNEYNFRVWKQNTLQAARNTPCI